MRTFRSALESGWANALELDVRLTKDGEVVVIHDRTTRRTTGKSYTVRRTELAVLRALLPDQPDRQIPTLCEVLALLSDHPEVPATIEVKAGRAVGPLVERLAEAELGNLLTLTSFNDLTVRRIRKTLARADLLSGSGERATVSVAPGLMYAVYFLAATKLGCTPHVPAGYRRLQIPVHRHGLTFASKAVVDMARRCSLDVDLWTIDDPATMEWALDELAVDGIMTDRPSVLAAVVGALEGAISCDRSRLR